MVDRRPLRWAFRTEVRHHGTSGKRQSKETLSLLFLSARKQAMKILVISLLANTSLSESIEDVVVLTTKLRIARTCVAHLTGPLDREVRSDCI